MKKEPIDALKRMKHHQWFSAARVDTDEGWWGPHRTIEDAALEALCSGYCDDSECYVTTGYKKNKEEREEYDDDFDWMIDSATAFKITLPRNK